MGNFGPFDVGSEHGLLVEVTQSRLKVVLRGDASAVNRGDEVILNLVHAREARYEPRCRVLENHVTPDGRILVLTHDESPHRIQLRDNVRVAARGTITLQPVPPWPARLESPERAVAHFEDVSGGGALVRSPKGLVVQACIMQRSASRPDALVLQVHMDPKKKRHR